MHRDAHAPTGPQVHHPAPTPAPDAMPEAVVDAGILTADEVAQILKVDVRTVRRHATTLGAIRVGDTWRFPHPRTLMGRTA